ncbi:MAG: amidohydrolase family protein, partial [Actinomycetota bacterium]|nr:amidohydrolase family protein [Actinomycetota bacterium]
MNATLFRGGGVFDGRRHRSGQAVLVRDGRIEAVLPETQARGAGAAVTTVELDGGLLAPGFIDAHVHAVQGGLERIRCDLSAVHTREGYRGVVAAYAEAHPDLDWLLGGGWSMAAFPDGRATAAELDAVVADRPVFLLNRDHHGAWVNTRAMQLAGIDRRT